MQKVTRQKNRIKRFLGKYSNNKLAVFGLFIIAFATTIAVLAPVISPYDPFKLGEEVFSEPSLIHLLGTDDLGRDILSQVIWGMRISLVVGFLAVVTAVFIGIAIGGISGYFGGKLDEFLMRVTEFFYVIPKLLLAVVLVSFWGSNFLVVIIVIAITTWPYIARVVRAEFLSLKNLEFTEAARATGAGNLEIIFSEILPNALSPVVVVATYQMGRAIFIEAGLAFLGLEDPNVMSCGYLLSMANRFIFRSWWMSAFPGLVLFMLILGINLIGDGLTYALNPTER